MVFQLRMKLLSSKHNLNFVLAEVNKSHEYLTRFKAVISVLANVGDTGLGTFLLHSECSGPNSI